MSGGENQRGIERRGSSSSTGVHRASSRRTQSGLKLPGRTRGQTPGAAGEGLSTSVEAKKENLPGASSVRPVSFCDPQYLPVPPCVVPSRYLTLQRQITWVYVAQIPRYHHGP